MNITISENGDLYLERPEKPTKGAQCPYTSLPQGGMFLCGDWCPFFGEPVYNHTRRRALEVDVKDRSDKLPICNVVLYGKITDNRKKPKKGTDGLKPYRSLGEEK